MGKALKAVEIYNKVEISKEFLDLYWREDVMTEDEMAIFADTGDVLLFRFKKRILFVYLSFINKINCEGLQIFLRNYKGPLLAANMIMWDLR